MSFSSLYGTALSRALSKLRCQELSVHSVVFGDDPVAFFVFECDGEQLFVGSGLSGSVHALATVMQNAQRWRVFPVHYLPGNQRMLGFRGANKSCVLFAIVLFPSSKLFLAVAVAHGIEIFCSNALGGAVAQGIEVDGVRGSRQGIAVLGAGKHGTLSI